jgi:hypothetical protein
VAAGAGRGADAAGAGAAWARGRVGAGGGGGGGVEVAARGGLERRRRHRVRWLTGLVRRAEETKRRGCWETQDGVERREAAGNGGVGGIHLWMNGGGGHRGGERRIKIKINGDAGDRTPCLSHAKRALYHLSYIPFGGLSHSSNLLECSFFVHGALPMELHPLLFSYLRIIIIFNFYLLT